MGNLINFYTGLGLGEQILLCLILGCVILVITYVVVMVIGKHNMKKRKQLEMVKKNKNVRK